MMSEKIILGLFAEAANAEDAIGELEDAGYNPKDMSLLMKDTPERAQIVNNTGVTSPVADGAVSGATTGAVVGGIAGLLVGIGAITIPGLGALFIAGPLATALGLTGAAATTVSGALTGALAGGLVGALVSLGVPQEDAVVYEQQINQGAILLAVPLDEGQESEVRGLLEESGAEQVRAIAFKGRTVERAAAM